MNHLLADARREVVQKSRSQIDEETAYKWASRSVAAYHIFTETHLHKWLRDAAYYQDEAVEHAAMADETGAVLHAVRQWLRQYVPVDVL